MSDTTNQPNLAIAVLGLGQMGAAIAGNLAADPVSLTVWNRNADKAKGIDASIAASPREAAESSDIVISMLADDIALEAVGFGEDGVVGHLRGGAVHVGMSTVSPEVASRLAEAHAEAGESYISAPVFGRPEAARARRLSIIPSGDQTAIEACMPVFDRLGAVPFTFDRPDQANVFKLLVNFVSVATIEVMGEFFAAAEKAELPRDRMLEFLSGPKLGSEVVRAYAPIIAETRFEPAGFALPLGRKDVSLALAAAERLGVKLEAGELALSHIEAALEKGRGGFDWSGLTSVIREEAGLDPILSDRDIADD
jgi:3-hydroxyisobutyrate dehydrogenase-like beta-hydroxyacid dehydrogenase